MDIKLQGDCKYFVGVILLYLINWVFSSSSEKEFFVYFSKKNNPEYKCTDDICEQSICVQAHSMANIFWTSCLQGIKYKNKYFLIHVHVYILCFREMFPTEQMPATKI